MVIINIDQTKSQLSDLLELSLGGEEVVIAKGTSLIRLQPVPAKAGKRREGQLQDKTRQSEDWNSAIVNKEIFH